LSAGVRQNLLSLQNTASLMATTQNRLATGKKVNTALDNPTNFFTSAALKSRAGDLSALLDSMSNGIKTLEAADNGITAITKTIEQMQSTLRQARQDKSFKSTSYTVNIPTPVGTEQMSFSGGSVGTPPVAADLTTAVSALAGGAYTNIDFTNAGANNGSISFNIAVNGGTAVPITVTHADVVAAGGTPAATTATQLMGILNAKLATANVDATVTVAGGNLVFTADRADSSAADVTISGFTVTNGAAGSGIANASGTDGAFEAKTVDALVAHINTAFAGQVRASNDNGRLRIENLSTADLIVAGYNTASGVLDGAATTATIGGNTVRANFVTQFNGYIDQLNKLSDDASFNGVNLLRGDKLKITFNEAGTSTIEILAKDASGNAIAINTSTLGILQATNPQFDSDDTIDARLTVLGDALANLRAQGSAFGSNLSIVQNRQTFTKAMINTLETGADNLVLADSNEEGANMLALQTRQQLSTTALSLSAQADQAVLRLFG
jgi:flagellin-like hook-associated protein FlgL